MGPDLAHIDRRGLIDKLSEAQLRELGIKGLMLLDLRLCHRDSEAIAGDKNLPSVVSWLPEGAGREWLRDWLSVDRREERIAGMQELAATGEWHDLSCHLSGWHDDLQTMDLIYARWDADAPRRNASKSRRGKEWWRVLASYLHKEGPEKWDLKFFDIPDADMHEDPLELGQFVFSRRIGLNRKKAKVELIRCEFDSGRKPDEISWATFEKYLKEMKPR